MAEPLPPQVVVMGSGMAGLCAAIAARQAGARVRLEDPAPAHLLGGNARHARNLRICHDAPSPLFPGQYTQDDFLTDLDKASQGQSDPELARILVDQSRQLPRWLAETGVRFQTKAIPWSRRTAFALGGGTALMRDLAHAARRLGVHVHMGAIPSDIRPDGTARVICTGGYQADLDRLAQHWPGLHPGCILSNRGTAFATGAPLRTLLDLGAAPVGQAGAVHAVAVDARAPRHDGGIVTRITHIPAGLVVDGQGRRLGQHLTETGPAHYAQWGQYLAQTGPAWLILDAPGLARSGPWLYPPIQAATAHDLAGHLGIPPAILDQTIADNATALSHPPLAAFPLGVGVTFTALGVRVDSQARIVDGNGIPLAGLFAAGQIMAPAILGTGYLAGAALTIAAVFGRIAGTRAARHALG